MQPVFRFSRTALANPPSGIREVMVAAAKIPDAIHLEVGQPDFATPEPIVAAAKAALDQGHTTYTPNAGIDTLRAAAAHYFERRCPGVETHKDQILVTPGAVMSVATAFAALLDPGDEVLLPDPSWPNYVSSVGMMHGVAVPYALRPDKEFLPDLTQLEQLCTARTKCLVLNSPSNPTGQVFDDALLADLMQLARDNNLAVLSDEIYSDIFHDQHSPVGAGSTATPAPASVGAPSVLPHDTDGRSIVVTGVSKSYSMTGFRIGITRASSDYVALATKIQEAFVSCSAAPCQHAAAVAFDSHDKFVRPMAEAYARRAALATAVLRDHGLWSYSPRGAMYVMVDISSTGLNSRDFVHRLLKEYHVAVAPGATFGKTTANHVRVSIAASDEDVVTGITRLCEFIHAETS